METVYQGAGEEGDETHEAETIVLVYIYVDIVYSIVFYIVGFVYRPHLSDVGCVYVGAAAVGSNGREARRC